MTQKTSVVSTELLEHVLDWRKVISDFKRILKPIGILIITTRSYGFKYHAFPNDLWRYELEDFNNIFSDLEIISLEKDSQAPGVFIKAVKPNGFVEKNLNNVKLYNIVLDRRVKIFGTAEINSAEFKTKMEKISQKEIKKTKRQESKARRKAFKKKIKTFILNIFNTV